MKRTTHRELKDTAHLWQCRYWHFQDIADMECLDYAQRMADLAEKVENIYRRAARFEIDESEARARAAKAAREYDQAFARLSKGSRDWAEDIIPRMVPVFRKLWRGQLWAGQ